LLAHAGDIDTPFYLRSSAKPFQAFISQESGAGLEPLELAMVSASHRGHPVHVALVMSVLETAGLDESALQCPEAWPLNPDAARRLHLDGESRPRRIWHNCSGKHAGFLRACVGSGWPIESYLSPEHPLQRQIIEFVSELGGSPVEPVGVDGCGAPVLRTTARAMSLLFSRLACDPSLREVFDAMHRYPSLIGSNGEGDSTIAISINAAAKGGAQGCIGVALDGRLGVAVKSWDGLGDIADVGAVAALDQLGELTPTARSALSPIARPEVLGGGTRVGETRPGFELTL
jgi:L-asparaginase II